MPAELSRERIANLAPAGQTGKDPSGTPRRLEADGTKLVFLQQFEILIGSTVGFGGQQPLQALLVA